MADLHIEEFYRDAAIALVQLYHAFPRRTDVYVEDIAGPDQPDEFGLHSRRHMACFGALLWLADEGFLRYVDLIRQEALDQAVLTQKGFLALSRVIEPELRKRLTPDSDGILAQVAPSVQDELATAVNMLRTCLRDGHSTRISEAVHVVLFTQPSGPNS